MSEPQQTLPKKARVDSTTPLAERGILQHVLGYLGPGHWLFAALVSRGWQQAYLKVPVHQMISSSPVACVPHMTLYSAAVASAARLTLAGQLGLDFSCKSLQRAAGRWGDKATIDLVVKPGMSWYYVLVGALLSRSVDTLQWLVEELDCPLPEAEWSLRTAAFGGCTDILAYLKQRGMTLTEDLVEYAALNGQWSALQYLRNEGLEWTSATCVTAARMGHLTLLQQLRQQGCPWDADNIGIPAARGGNVQMLQWLKGESIVFTEATLAGAAAGGHIAACEHLRYTEQCPWSPQACMLAAKHEQVHALKWLRQHGCPCDHVTTTLFAALGGSVAVLAYMLEQPEQQQLDAAFHTALLREMLAVAGANQQLAAAQWLRAQGAAWPDVLRYNVNGEQQQWRGAVLEWARAEGCTSPVE
jgi:hypothetical protein